MNTFAAALVLALTAAIACAADYEATPDTLAGLVPTLKPGDTVMLADGQYEGGLEVAVSGEPDNPITLKASGDAALFVGGRNGIHLEGDYIVIDGVKATGARRGGITSGRNTGCVIRNCVSYDNGVWGIFSGYSEHLTVENNVCYGSKREHGIYLSNSADYAIVRGNHCYNNKRCGIQFNGDPALPGDGVMSHNLIENNIIHDNWTSINLTCVSDSLVRNNLFYGNQTKAIALWDTVAGYEYAAKNNVLVNNTFIMDLSTRECIQIRNGSTGNVIRNNIFVAPFQAIICDTSAVEGTVIDHNLYFSSIEPERFIWAGEYRTIGDMQEAGYCEGAVRGDPLFADPENGDFSLRPGSPAIDAGIAEEQSGDKDLAGNPRTIGAAIDIGAYEAEAE